MAADRYKHDPFWKGKRLTPAQLLVHDIGLESLRPGKEPRLEINEIPSSSLIADTSDLVGGRTRKEKDDSIPIQGRGWTRSEQQRLKDLRQEYGWMNELRKPKNQDDECMCRWM